MSEKRFPATEMRLRKLRAVGVFPRSDFFQLAGVGLGVLCINEILPRYFNGFLRELNNVITQASPEMALRSAGHLVLIGAVVLILPIVIGRIVVGMVETRGGIWWDRVAPKGIVPRWGRNSRGGENEGGVPHAWALLGKFCGVIVFMAVFFLVGHWFFGKLPNSLLDFCCQPRLADSGQQIVGAGVFQDLLHQPVRVLSATLVFLGLLGLMVSHWLFRRQQMMTRDEMLAEVKEQEGSEFARKALASGRAELQ